MRVKLIVLIAQNVRKHAHTIILGDLNMTFHSLDRIKDDGTPCGNIKGKDIDAWRLHLSNFNEFDQPLYTCKYTGGCSKLDRVFTSLAPLEFSTIGTASNLLGMHALVSDHFPNSVRFFNKSVNAGTIKPWVAKSESFKKHVLAKLDDEGYGEGYSKENVYGRIALDPQGFAFKLQSIFRDAAKLTKQDCLASPPKTTQHKIALCATMQKSLISADFCLFHKIAKLLPQFGDIPLDGTYKSSSIYSKLLAFYDQQLQQLALEKAKENADRDSEDKFIEFGGLGSTYAVIYGLKPGGYSTISALQTHNGGSEQSNDPAPPTFTTDPSIMAAVLNKHWSGIFDRKDVDIAQVEFFASEIRGFASCELDTLLPSKEDAHNVLDRVTDSGVGPDLLPYSVYKVCPDISVALILSFVDFLVAGNGELALSFLIAFMVFLPKKSFAQTPSGLRLYKAENTRPLSLSNTLIKLVLTCMKLKLCQFIDARIHRFQKCISGRNLLENVLKLDAVMHIWSTIVDADAAALLFDFVAAFPSVDHKYMWYILEAAGLPLAWIRAVQKCYHNNKHVIKLEGRVFDGPTILAGVRQGCPLSMILFAIMVEPLLRLLEKIAKDDDEVGCFADDIGLVFREIRKKIVALAELFERFKKASNLDLNTGKCVAIPLEDSEDACANLSALISENVPQWKDFKVALSSEYLGFQVGPGSASIQWNKVIAKASDTVVKWQSLHLGFFFNLLACNVFILSLFSYLGQLCTPNQLVIQFMHWLKNKLFTGPGNWIPISVLHDIKELGFPAQLRELCDAICASKVRVFAKLPEEFNELSVRVGTAINGYGYRHGPEHRHFEWHKNCMLRNLVTADQYVKPTLRPSDAAYGCLRNSKGKKKKGLQKVIYEHIRGLNRFARKSALIEMLRKKLKRYDLQDMPIAHAAQRAFRRLELLRGRCKPTMHITYLKALLNAWPTSRRMRSLHGGPIKKCPLCDARDAQDSIEHFAHCETCRVFFEMNGVRHGGIPIFLALDSDCIERRFLIKKIKCLHAIMITRRTIINHPPSLPPLSTFTLLRASLLKP